MRGLETGDDRNPPEVCKADEGYILHLHFTDRSADSGFDQSSAGDRRAVFSGVVAALGWKLETGNFGKLTALGNRRGRPSVMTAGGFDFTGADCIAWMRETGFRDLRVEPLAAEQSMVVGIK